MTDPVLAASITAATALAGLLAALLSVLRYFSYRTRRDRIASLGLALDAVVEGLGSGNTVTQAAAAIRIRRFFDRRSELGAVGAAYAGDALNVTAAVLRELSTGDVQKLLADGLAYAPTLANADLQRTNLQNAYLADTNLDGADLFGADLTGASLKRASTRRTSFYRTQLARTVLIDAHLDGAQFIEADLRDVRIGGARLAGARFVRCENVPSAIADELDASGMYSGPVPMPPSPHPVAGPHRFFLSRPFLLTPDQHAVVGLIGETVRAAGGEVVMLQRDDAPRRGVLTSVRQSMVECSGVIVLGLQQLEVSQAHFRSNSSPSGWVTHVALPTPWNHIEAGIARGLGIPMLRVHDANIRQGVFDPDAADEPLVELSEGRPDTAMRAIDTWVREIVSR